MAAETQTRKDEEQQHQADSSPPLHPKTRQLQPAMASLFHVSIHSRISSHDHLHKRVVRILNKNSNSYRQRRHRRHNNGHQRPNADHRDQHAPPLRLQVQRHVQNVVRRDQTHLGRAKKMLFPMQFLDFRAHPRDPSVEGAEPQRPDRLHRREPLLRRLHRGEAPGNRRLRRPVHHQD